MLQNGHKLNVKIGNLTSVKVLAYQVICAVLHYGVV
jgi:hypothetical protein